MRFEAEFKESADLAVLALKKQAESPISVEISLSQRNRPDETVKALLTAKGKTESDVICTVLKLFSTSQDLVIEKLVLMSGKDCQGVTMVKTHPVDEEQADCFRALTRTT
ncbi:hypothetical protein HZC53_06075 [Candidatus Uhrbacteria bacterium]|nr:hypothetical protein [Candidatus Uhrbacteria bacterium]